jgi:hypothetical protein
MQTSGCRNDIVLQWGQDTHSSALSLQTQWREGGRKERRNEGERAKERKRKKLLRSHLNRKGWAW